MKKVLVLGAGLVAKPLVQYLLDQEDIQVMVASRTVSKADKLVGGHPKGQTLSLKQREFVDAARLIGVSTPGIIFRHITPNLFGVVIVYVTLTIPQAILVESFISFLGLGVQEPQTSLGALVNNGVSYMEQAPWLILIPATLLALILMCFNFLGDGLRDLADPKKNI